MSVFWFRLVPRRRRFGSKLNALFFDRSGPFFEHQMMCRNLLNWNTLNYIESNSKLSNGVNDSHDVIKESIGEDVLSSSP